MVKRGAESTGDEAVRVHVEGSILVIEEDRYIEHSVPKSIAGATLSAKDVTDYTNSHGLYYLDVTSIEDKKLECSPMIHADLVVAHANVLMCPIDGGEPGPGRETGTLIDKSYVCGFAVTKESIIHKHATKGNG